MVEDTVGDTGEIWKLIQGFDGYEASNFGRIRSLIWNRTGRTTKDHGPIIRKLTLDRGWYLTVSVRSSHKPIKKPVSRLVLMAFTGLSPSSDIEAAHINGIKTDNRIENLEWKTAKENCADRARHGRNPDCERGPNSILTADQVMRIRTIDKDTPTSVLAEMFGVGRTTIQRARNGKSWSNLAAFNSAKISGGANG